MGMSLEIHGPSRIVRMEKWKGRQERPGKRSLSRGAGAGEEDHERGNGMLKDRLKEDGESGCKVAPETGSRQGNGGLEE